MWKNLQQIQVWIKCQWYYENKNNRLTTDWCKIIILTFKYIKLKYTEKLLLDTVT